MRRAWVIASIITLLLPSRSEAREPAGAEIPTWTRRAPNGSLRVWPSFAGTMDSPEFVLEFTNTSAMPSDALNVVMAEAIRLDGQTYPRLAVKWAGQIPPIGPGKSWSHRVAISDFLPGSQRLQYSDVLRYWRWKVPLKSGNHTVTFMVGDASAAETIFSWNGDLPVLYR